jgi:hypothetical protein
MADCQHTYLPCSTNKNRLAQGYRKTSKNSYGVWNSFHPKAWRKEDMLSWYTWQPSYLKDGIPFEAGRIFNLKFLIFI